MAKVDYATLKKGGFMRQKQKNNFSLRLACVGGALTAENLKKIAEVAEKYGDGYVHLTSRQGVEIPFIKLDQIDENEFLDMCCFEIEKIENEIKLKEDSLARYGMAIENLKKAEKNKSGEKPVKMLT